MPIINKFDSTESDLTDKQQLQPTIRTRRSLKQAEKLIANDSVELYEASIEPGAQDVQGAPEPYQSELTARRSKDTRGRKEKKV